MNELPTQTNPQGRTIGTGGPSICVVIIEDMREVREGLVKHYTSYDHPSKRRGFDAKSSSLEAQVANLADEIAYYSHDLDDGLTSGLLSESRLDREAAIWTRAARWVRRQFGRLPDECRRYYVIRCIIDDQVRYISYHSWNTTNANTLLTAV